MKSLLSLNKYLPMKKLLLTFVILVYISLCVQAQTTSYGSFKTEDQEIVYQKVFQQDSITTDLLEAYYKTLPFVSNVTSSSDGIQFEVNDITVDFKKFQFKPIDTPPIIQTGRYSGKVFIGAKDGRYRVTFRSIQVTGDIGYKKITAKDNLTNYACKNNGTILAQDWCRPNMFGLLDKAFTDKLQYIGKKKGDW
jgi:hypothetical protein